MYYIRYANFKNHIGVSCSRGHTITLIDKKNFAGSWNEMMMGYDKFACSECEKNGCSKVKRVHK